ncbi:hypothetical protein HELRODRAFT_177387 [Helobdella robusta]|uniref:Uncharacterized protein n=1 Tax=Helobdella robusta TaxID=6412 RepID=T1FBL6_HELRO|nr:hypothetical protein HELRODRAFT_177387 [Helobdella robusta]ESN98144.1 hypothetical protein HELRODRAFT_177387 [Helobdella robusta]
MTEEGDGNIEFLLECYEKIKASPKDASNYAERCRAFMKLKHYFYAIEDARKIINDINPSSPLGYKLLAEIYRLAEIYEEEIKVLEFGILSCNRDHRREFMKLKKVAESKLAERKIVEKNTFYAFLLIGCFLGMTLAMLATRLQLLSTVMNRSLVFVLVLGVFVSMAVLVHWVYSRTRRTDRYMKIHPPYDVIDDNDELIRARDRGDFDYVGPSEESDDDDHFPVEDDESGIFKKVK